MLIQKVQTFRTPWSSKSTISPTFKIHSTIPQQDYPVLFQWGEDIFGGSQYNLQWRPTDVHVVGYLDGKPVTHVGIVKHRVAIGSTEMVVGGVGGVVTVPHSQKKGFAKLCLVQAHQHMSSVLGVDFGFLFCPDRLVKYYESVGWKKIEDKVIVDQPSGKIVAPLCAMVLEFSRHWPEGPVTLGSLPW